MEGGACIRVAACNIGTLEKHNSRDPEYMARLEKQRKVYVRRDLKPFNETRIFKIEGGDLHAHLDYLRRLVKEKTGRKMQAKATPLREAVLILSATNTMEDVKNLAKAMEERWGMVCLRIDIHRDEGHWQERGQWVPNLHAHMVFDWINHETGKSCCIKNSEGGMSELQDMAAKFTGRPRGESKEKTRRQHLGREEWVQQRLCEREKTLEEVVKVLQGIEREKDREEKERERISQETRAAQSQLQALRNEGKKAEEEVKAVKAAAAKEKAKLRKDIGKAIGQRIGQAVGVGKLAEAEHRVQQAEEEVKAVKAAAAKERSAEMRAAHNQLQKAKDELQKVKQDLSEREDELKDVRLRLARIAYVLYDLCDAVQVAVLAIIEFAKNQGQAILHREQVAAVKAAVREIGGEDKDEQEQAGGMLCDCAAAIGELTISQQHKAQKEVQDAICGKFELGMGLGR